MTDDELEGLFAHDDTYLERSKLLKEAYRKLSANQRHAVYLYYIKELNMGGSCRNTRYYSALIHEPDRESYCQITTFI